jgi:capsular exopolysaccharide synthesis family protein
VLDVSAKAESEREAVKLANTFARSALAIRDQAIRRQVTGAITRTRAQLEDARDSNSSTVEIAQRLEQLQSVQSDGDPTLGLAQRAVIASPEGASKAVVLILALIAGLALGSGAAVLLELFTRRVRTDDELLALYPRPILARVPQLPRRQRSGASDGMSWHMPAPVREGFRTLIAQLAKAQDDGPAAIMMTSASTGDGKTTSAINLAVALASSGRTVVLLDLDIRKPDIGRSLGMQASAGPTSLLTMTNGSLGSLLRPVPQLPSLLVLPIGATSGDAGLVEAVNARVPDLLEEARGLADYVVIDTAPLGEVSDALTISRLVDDVIVVARSGQTNRTNLTIMRDLLERAGRPPTGYLLIGEAPGASTSYYAHGVAGRPLFAEPEDVSKASSS